jgi:hypothetical protein
MGTTLTGTTPATTYDSLIKVTDNGPLSGTLKALSDGLGNDSALALSTGAAAIGTTTADSTLTVSSGTVNAVANFKSTDALAYIAIADNSSSDALSNYMAVVGDNMYFATNDTERLRITSTGNVGIGTTSPASPLSVGGTAIYDLPASTANFSTAAAGKFQLRLTSSSFNVDGNWVGLGMGYHQNYMKTAIIARASDGSARGTLNFCINSSAGSDNVTLADTRVAVTANGLTFNGDTAAANALDDYEEGTWTPAFVLGGGSVTYTTQTGTYTKIGRLVTIQMRIEVNVATTPSSTLEVTGLPFTVLFGSKGAISIWATGMDAASKVWAGVATPLTNKIRIYTYDAGSVSNPAVDLQNGCVMNITATYEV